MAISFSDLSPLLLLHVPDDVVVALDGSLLPHRAQLVRFVEWRRREEQALQEATHNRDRLKGELAECKEALAAVDKAVKADAGGLVDRIKSGSQWSLATLSGKSRADLDAKRSAALHRVEVGGHALAALESDVAEREERVGKVAEQQEKFVHNALREHAEAEYGPRYTKALDELFDIVAVLAAVDELVGRTRTGRLIIDLPGGYHRASAIDRMRPVLRKFVDHWSVDPLAAPLSFPPARGEVDPNETEPDAEGDPA